MAVENQPGMACAEFEALLSDALDQTLAGAKLQNFQAHGASCAVCGPMLKNAEAGQDWLKSLQDAEPPVTLVNDILVATTGLRANRLGAAIPSRASWWEQFTALVFAPVMGVVRQPRFVMSFGMAFFSVSICLSLAGIRLSDLRAANLRPSVIKRNYYETSGRVVKYYENIRFVYEMESRVREFKRMTAPSEPAHDEDKSKERRNDTSGRPDQKEDRNYRQGETSPLLAETSEPAIATANTLRRSL
jgi:hypothetical protein